MIIIDNIHYHIKQTPILNGVNLTLPKSGIIALIGPNGAGKSFLLSLMSRLKPLQQGQITFDDLNITTADSGDIAKKLAILTQENTIQSRLTVYDILMFGRYPYHQGRPTDECRKIVAKALQHFELQDYANRYLSELSGGQRQRALIAMVFCQSTDYVLLDEPLNNLDMYHSRELMKLLRQLADHDNRTIVVVLHDITQAAAYADHIVALKQGRVLFEGSPRQVITTSNIYQLFGVECDVIEHKGVLRVLY
ncbi:ATP-binding cassette domain-containing protein [Otariodibacter sp.]|uniref:iron ABC transporter ATP-binding protein n=1 Tax=Otariodibacter sp. TaxID=3030919 RepID=UPI0026151140|nr:ATP-binding cassette domain-containing protein [Otariodibacter sp.]